MTGRERRVERDIWLMQRDLAAAGDELRSARLRAGLTLRQVGARVGVVPSVILKTERGLGSGPRPAMLAAHAAAVGMRARIKVYPEGEPLRDSVQVAMIGAFRTRLLADVPFRAEQPVTNELGDRRAFDGLLLLRGCRCAVEFISRFHDCQAQLRELHLKARDGDVDRLVLVVKATHHNRRAIAAAADVIATSFPLGTRRVMAALASGRDPGANGIVFL